MEFETTVTLPPLFTDRMKALLCDEYGDFLASFEKPGHPSLRVNTLKLSSERLREIASFAEEQIPWQENGFYYTAHGDIRPGKHPLHEAGAYYIQEASAMLPASLCPPVAGDRVLDLCAAPGGKATQLAAALGGEGLLVANEIHPTRAGVLSQNIERMGVRNAIVTNAAPAELAERFPAFFDKIVVDAPCSGEGMFRKEPDAVTMWSPENVSLCASRQAEILEEAAKMLCVGGYLTYSTCTFAPAENEGAVLEFLLRHPEFEVVPSTAPAVVASREAGLLDGGRPEWVENSDTYPEALRQAVTRTYRILPHHCNGEGHFAALLRKTAEGEALPPPRKSEKKKSKKANGKAEPAPEAAAMKLFESFAKETLGGMPSWASDTLPRLFGDRLYLIPSALSAGDPSEVLKGLRVLRAGLCVGSILGLDRGRGRFEPDHALAMTLSENTFPMENLYHPVDEATAVAYLRGETFPTAERGWRIVTFEGLPLGWGKASDGVMKNHYPKGLRWN